MSISHSDPLASYRAGIIGSRWFASLPAGLQHGLLADAVVRQLQTGERLFIRGDAFDGIYCVLRGILSIVGSNETGKEAMLAMLEPYNWFGEIALFDGLERTHDVIADTSSVVLRVPKHVLTQLLTTSPSYWQCFGVLLSHKMRFAFVALEEAALLPTTLRVARRLVLMAEGYGELKGHSRRVLPFPQEQLASMLSVSRQTINQVLRQFEGQGLIRLNYRELEICDLDGLRRAGAELST